MKTKNKTPLRQCTGCREMKSKKEMIRVLRTPENEIVLDATGRKNGRGAYVCLSQECLEKAVKTRGLERSLKTAIPDEVYEDLKKELNDIFSNYKTTQLINAELLNEETEFIELKDRYQLKVSFVCYENIALEQRMFQ